jgi:hypothetical protein
MMRRWFKRGADAVGAGLFAALFIVFLIQIVARFGFNRPLPWTDEAAVMLYVWVILWAAAFVVPEREHVMFDLVWNVVGRRSPSSLYDYGLATYDAADTFNHADSEGFVKLWGLGIQTWAAKQSAALPATPPTATGSTND